ncbi:unnamed protein product [Discula destructiva]
MTTTGTTAEDGWPKTMRSWTYNSATSLDTALSRNDQAPPQAESTLSPTSVLIQVLYMAVNPADYKLAELGMLARPLISLPASPGMDYSGRVVRAGKSMGDTYQPGQLVFGRVDPSKYGTLSEFIVVSNGEALAHVPQGLEAKMAELASVGTCGLTAWQSIKPYLPKEAEGSKVFINAGSGGLGTFGIQIAKALGCHVTTSCSGGNVELCRNLGADEVIDYKTQDVSQVLKSAGKVFQLVVDNVGGSSANEQDLYVAANEFLRDDGHFIQVGGGVSKAMFKTLASRALVPGFLGGGKRPWKFIMTAQSHADLESIGVLIKSGAVKPVLDEVFAFEDAAQAYKKLKGGRARGKILVKVSE